VKDLTATDRKALIRLASSLPKGSEERKAILAGLEKTAASDVNLSKSQMDTLHKDGEVVVNGVKITFGKTARTKIAGGTDFWEWGAGSDPRKIFSDLQDDAKHEYGHGGYSGSIAEKDGYKIRSREKMSTKEAEAFANEDMDNNDKWGPAFAVPSGNGWLFYGIASS